MTTIGMIWAQSRDGIIGDRDTNTIPWDIPEDLDHFKAITHGHPVIMGRKTWESLPQSVRPLPGRDNYILSSREPGEWSEGATVVTGLLSTLDLLQGEEQVWIIGGAEIFQHYLYLAHIVERTIVDADLWTLPVTSPVVAPDLSKGFLLEDVRKIDRGDEGPSVWFEHWERP